ncbi:Helicase ATP-binding domain-containing protein [Caenorhabditis elegans]|uniref:Helicase ATP-binding domain-containing protein n=1 Tax=Caenorhabditis elegans TaxID=6239 RepID=A0A0K2WNK1_CAEEL|nr:Helicase ATP-binding domain-containing protein [Caenorhabditis elegans]CEO43064.2 Helicase ATP-binding domain-containing protein [Caenorhabditis elegans]|eukprot:NP_001300390.1 Uncharacterized protein CELE_Y106G6D.5 [Caenorhabditis elegans]
MKLLRSLNYGTLCKLSTSAQSLKKSSRLLKKQPKNKISLTPKFLDNVREWPKIFEAEIEAQFEKLDEMIRNKVGWRVIEERGLCVGNLIVTSKYYDSYCGEVITLSGDAILRTRWLKAGTPVLLNKLNEDGHLQKVSDGHVVDCTAGIVKVCAYDDKNVDFSTLNYILTPSTNSGALKFLQSVIKNPSSLSSDSVHLVNLAYRSIPMPSIHDRKIGNLPETLNPSQVAAVSAAMNTQRNLLCIQGPPGTGKTRVIAEIVHQLMKKKKKVLVCAPTHVAVRNAMDATTGRMIEEMPEEKAEQQLCLLANTKDEFQNHKSASKLEEIKKQLSTMSTSDPLYKKMSYEYYLIRNSIFRSIFYPKLAVFSTLGTSSIQKLPEYHWNADVMIVDEAAQCTEPATWVPVLTTPSCKKLILVGDQKQLPAVVLSDKAMKGNFKLSLMEKLAEEFSSNNINILLNEQYRMNKKIMNWSNEVFYENQLTAHSTVSDITLRDICPNLPEDHVLNNPIMMINMENVKDRSHEEFESHSFTNTDELNLVTEYVNRLVVDLGINPKAIAVISPYYAQIEKLRRSIPFRVDVNTVDAFQGHERQVVIFCLVRDNDEGQIGFLNETRRLNVAVTRARRQFVLIGNGRMMKGNKHLLKLYKHLQSEKVIFGPSILETFNDLEEAALPRSDKF